MDRRKIWFLTLSKNTPDVTFIFAMDRTNSLVCIVKIWNKIPKLVKNISVSIVLVYIDDIVVTGSKQEGILKLKVALHERFAIIDLGVLKYFYGK